MRRRDEEEIGRRCQGVAGPGEGMMRREAGARGGREVAAEVEVGAVREGRVGRGREEKEEEAWEERWGEGRVEEEGEAFVEGRLREKRGGEGEAKVGVGAEEVTEGRT